MSPRFGVQVASRGLTKWSASVRLDSSRDSGVPIVLLPGMGTDSRLFQPQARRFPSLMVPPWIEPVTNESLPSYARRMAAAIPRVRPLLLGGVSFGGMLAYEMASVVRPDAVVLIASCRTEAGIRPFSRRLAPAVQQLPVRVIDLVKRVAPWVIAALPRLSKEQQRLCAEMFQDTGSRFLQWAFGAITAWRPSEPHGVPVRQIHGARDPMIPAAVVQADELIPDGGHLINLTHANRVNAFLQRVLDDIQEFRDLGI
jgi:pimeloyl-ACP methyl ester carboxylesterase